MPADPSYKTVLPGHQGQPYELKINRLKGGTWVYTDASTVTLEVDGPELWMFIEVSDGENLSQVVRLFEDLECDLSVSGAGGLHNDFAEAIDTPYVIYAAWDPSTRPDADDPDNPADVCLFAVPSGTVVNAALVAALTGGGYYSWWSEPIGLMINDGAGDILHAYYASGLFWFDENYSDLKVLLNGKATASTPIDISAFVPNEAICFLSLVLFEQSVANPRIYYYYTYNGTIENQKLFGAVQSAAGYETKNYYFNEFPVLNDPADLIRYKWNAAPADGTDYYIFGVRLF